MAHHLGIRGDIAGYRYRTLVSYAKNYGRYRDGDALKSTNTAILLEVNKQVPQWWNLDFHSRWVPIWARSLVIHLA